MQTSPSQPVDKNGAPVSVGQQVRVLKLTGDWLDSLTEDERTEVKSMIGEIFPIDEFDEYGHPWVVKWFNHPGATTPAHFVALMSDEFELVDTHER